MKNDVFIKFVYYIYCMSVTYREGILYNMKYKTYGKSIRIKKAYIKLICVVCCLITPCTNWAIPFLFRLIKNDMVIRYGN